MKRTRNVRFGGSSPRGRGKRIAVCNSLGALRLIPARAGKTGTVVVSQSMSAAHPRAGGENPQLGFGTSISEGSSPRGRGKLDPALVLIRRGGLIPARAGKTQGD